jgi:hypothetical protein
MIQKVVSDIINQFLSEMKKDETFERIERVVLDPISKYVRKTTYPYIHLVIFILLLYTITLPIIIVILFRQNRLLTHCISIIKQSQSQLTS